jgi:S1-C subfamily serine protease
MGIISGLERSSTMVGIPHKKVDYIQTDAAINPGRECLNPEQVCGGMDIN